jgi:hypothetical protein
MTRNLGQIADVLIAKEPALLLRSLTAKILRMILPFSSFHVAKSFMSASFSPTPDDSGTSFSGGESIVERAVRQSFEEKQQKERAEASQSFSRDEHLKIAESGAADLSAKEKIGLFEKLDGHSRAIPAQPADTRQSRPIPLFFGSWSGMNPFRFVKPFFLQKKKKDD